MPITNVRDFGAIGDGIYNDTTSIQAAIDSAGIGGSVLFPAGDYIITTLVCPSGMKFIGEGYHMGATNPGSRIRRNSNNVGITVTGTSILASGTHLANVEFHGMDFHGGNFTADMLAIECASFVVFNSCRLEHCGGRAIKATEVFGLRLFNCVADWIGSAAGTLPGIELVSGGDYEYTNRIHFNNCDFESYPGTLLKTTGLNTNEIFFTDCGIESLISNQIHINMEKTVTVFFNNVTLTSKGTAGSTIPEVIKLDSCTNIQGSLFMEHMGVPGETSAVLTNFINITKTSNIRLDLTAYSDVFGGESAILTDGLNAATNTITGRIISNALTKPILNT